MANNIYHISNNEMYGAIEEYLKNKGIDYVVEGFKDINASLRIYDILIKSKKTKLFLLFVGAQNYVTLLNTLIDELNIKYRGVIPNEYTFILSINKFIKNINDFRRTLIDTINGIILKMGGGGVYNDNMLILDKYGVRLNIFNTFNIKTHKKIMLFIERELYADLEKEIQNNFDKYVCDVLCYNLKNIINETSKKVDKWLIINLTDANIKNRDVLKECCSILENYNKVFIMQDGYIEEIEAF